MRRPVPDAEYFDGGFFFASSRELRICGVGKSEREAKADFYAHVEHFKAYYKSLSQEQVIGDAIRLKAIFDKM